MTAAKMTCPVQVWSFLTAGNATVTLRSARTGHHYTFKVRRPKPDSPMFVSLLSGPDNQGDYNYVGLLTDRAQLVLTRKSRMNDGSTPVRAFRYFLGQLAGDEIDPELEVWHEGKCGRCGRKLTVPESVATGVGPECAGKL